jgi:hypothetical protein
MRPSYPSGNRSEPTPQNTSLLGLSKGDDPASRLPRTYSLPNLEGMAVETTAVSAETGSGLGLTNDSVRDARRHREQV